MSEEEAHARFVGKTFASMLDEMRQEFGVSFPADASLQKDLRLLQLYETELKAVEGVVPALEALGQQHFSVASNSPFERVEAALRITHLTRFFGNRITTFEHVARGKPEPDVFIEAARRAGYTRRTASWWRIRSRASLRPIARAAMFWALPAPTRTRANRQQGCSRQGPRRPSPKCAFCPAWCRGKNSLTLHCNTAIWAVSLKADIRNT